jgi:hypothetical protein
LACSGNVPVKGWGTPQQLHDSVYAATKFYQKLLTISGWQAIPLRQAAQAVQRSATPDAYAKHEPAATMLVTMIAAGLPQGIAADVSACLGACPASSQPRLVLDRDRCMR